MAAKIIELLGADADSLLNHECKTIPKETIHIPSPSHVEDIWINSNRSNQTLKSLQSMLNHGRLGGTGYVSILPVDQGIEHSAGASFAPNPIYFDAENIVKLAIEGGCNAVASTFGVLGIVSRKFAHRIPIMVKINHNEFLTYPMSRAEFLIGKILFNLFCLFLIFNFYLAVGVGIKRSRKRLSAALRNKLSVNSPIFFGLEFSDFFFSVNNNSYRNRLHSAG